KRKPWEKNRPQKKKGGAKKKAQKPLAKKVVVAAVAPSLLADDDEKKESKNEKDDDGDEGSLSSSDSPPKFDESDPDDDWSEHSVKKVTFDAKSHKTHLVHCPYFPPEKFEWWWLILTMLDKKQRRLVCPTVACKTLVDQQTVEMRFSAPPVKGVYHFQLSVRSDSYMDCDYNKDIKLEVKEAKEIVLPKYEDTEDENEKVAYSSEEEYTEGSDSDQ
uniref:SEC63 domain-containing protein n=1 Tax=Angiostrongylus cantonensis TaxID=6313 RepID=A0A0K0D119_ANGCA